MPNLSTPRATQIEESDSVSTEDAVLAFWRPARDRVNRLRVLRHTPPPLPIAVRRREEGD